MPMLGVNGTFETNVFLSSVNTGVNARVNADALCEGPGGGVSAGGVGVLNFLEFSMNSFTLLSQQCNILDVLKIDFMIDFSKTWNPLNMSLLLELKAVENPSKFTLEW